MHIEQHVKKNGMQMEVDKLKYWGTVDVNFYNTADGREDEVQFDIKNPGTKDGLKELKELFQLFCIENRCSADTVTGVTLIRVADTYEELMELEAKEENYCYREEME